MSEELTESIRKQVEQLLLLGTQNLCLVVRAETEAFKEAAIKMGITLITHPDCEPDMFYIMGKDDVERVNEWR